MPLGAIKKRVIGEMICRVSQLGGLGEIINRGS